MAACDVSGGLHLRRLPGSAAESACGDRGRAGTMSDEQPFGRAGFVVDAGSDVAGERERAGALQASVPVPRMGGEDGDQGTVEYPLIEFPWEPWTLTSRMELTAAQAAAWADWLNRAEEERLAVFVSVLERAGAGVGAVRERPEELLALGAWIQRWFGLIAEPFVAGGRPGDPGWRRGFFQDEPELRLGGAWAPRRPSDHDYSRSGDVLLHSLAVDLAFLVTGCARAARPGLRWRATSDEHFQDYFLTPDPDPPPFALVREVREFLVQSVARRRGGRGRELLQWRGGTLYRCYQRAAAGVAQLPEYEAFPGANEYREGARYDLTRPRRGGPPPAPELVAAVAAFRQAGWFEAAKITAVSRAGTMTWFPAGRLTDAELAATARAAWQAFEGEDIPLASAEMAWRLLVLDSGRTWSEDVDADARPGDNIHEQTLFAIVRIGGKGFGGFRDAEEDWPAASGDVELSFWWGRRQHRLRLPAPGRYLSPALITGLNDLIPAGRPQLWFFDHGPPVAIVTRATAGERDALEQLTGIRLDSGPPAWWTDLAPLPPPQQPTPARQAAVTRGSRPRKAGERGGPVPSRPGPAAGQAALEPAAQAADRHGHPTTATAQDVFRQMMRGLITPALRGLGFTGTWPRAFCYQDGDYAGTLWTQKSVHSTEDHVNFTVHLSASHTPTNTVYWTHSLLGLIPGNQDPWWTVSATDTAGPAAARFLRAFRDYGWPAIQAALDSPGFPPDPAVRWARTFPPASRHYRPADPGPPAWILQPAGRDNDDLFAELGDEDHIARFSSVELIGDIAIDDPRAAGALINRLEHDPSEAVRRMAACGLRPLAGLDDVRRALQAAAAEDEDLEVRWEARYALRLARSARQGAS